MTSPPEEPQEPARTSNAEVAVIGGIWLLLAKHGTRILVVISTLVLARLLDRSEFGLAASAMLVIVFLEATSDLGVGPALIAAEDEQASHDTSFWLGFGSAILLFALTWIVAPWLGMLLREERVIPMIRCLGLSFPLAAIGNTHLALIQKRLQFRKRVAPQLARGTVKGVTAIVLAFMGFGAWSLVYGHLAAVAVESVLYWWASSWRPALRFDPAEARSLVRYGSHIVTLRLLHSVVQKMDAVLIANYLGSAALGVFTLALRLPELVVHQVFRTSGEVLFPVYSKMRDDPERMMSAFMSVIRWIALLILPLGLGLAVVADPIVRIALTDEWLDAAPIMAIVSLQYTIRSLVLNMGALYKAQGRPHVLTRLRLLQVALTLPFLWWVAARIGTLTAIAWAQVAMSVVFVALNYWVAHRELGISPLRVARELLSIVLVAIAMAVSVHFIVQEIPVSSPWSRLGAGVASGVALYGLGLAVVARPELMQLAARVRLIAGRVPFGRLLPH